MQATDAYMATRNARIVLVDDDGVRAVMTGSWLVQMGWPEVYVLDGGVAGRPLVHGAAEAGDPRTRRADGRDDRAGRTAGAARYGRGGSRRSGAEHRLRGRAHPGRLVRGAGAAARRAWTGAEAARAGLDLARRGGWRGWPRRSSADCGLPEIRVLDGGTAAWRAAGLPLATGREAMADTPDDCWRRPYDPYAGEGARERYLKWEIELVRQIEREGDVGFRVPG